VDDTSRPYIGTGLYDPCQTPPQPPTQISPGFTRDYTYTVQQQQPRYYYSNVITHSSTSELKYRRQQLRITTKARKTTDGLCWKRICTEQSSQDMISQPANNRRLQNTEV